jgi:hypothetical protein
MVRIHARLARREESVYRGAGLGLPFDFDVGGDDPSASRSTRVSALQQKQFPIDRAIFAEVLACIPDAWTHVRLYASVRETSSAGTTMSLSLDGSGQPGLAIVSDALQEEVRKLFLLNGRFNSNLRAISYAYERRPDGRWSFNASYEYA